MQHFMKKGKGCIKLIVNPKIYTIYSIYSAGYIFLDRAFIYLDKDKKDNTIVYLFPKTKKENLEKLGLEFYNELLNYSHYFTSLKANADVIKTLLQRALFSSAPSVVQESEEKEIQDIIKELEEEEKTQHKK